MIIKRHIGWLAPALLAAVATTAQAGGDVRLYGQGEVPRASEVADILRGEAAPAPRPKMRGISLDAAYTPANKLEKPLERVAKPTQTAIGLPVEFAFDSAQILPENEPQLAAVAEGIKMTGGMTVVVEGHTDAHGSDAYNQQLSLLRAQAVKRYLERHHGITASQLVIEGRGEDAPINTADPYAPENRRVQFRAAR